MNNLSKTDLINIVVIGFAIFSMLFGAGNVVFPPYLGFLARESWFVAFIFYFISDIGLGMLTFVSIYKSGSPDNVAFQVGKFWGTALMITIMLCLGPLVVFPRTAATAFEMSIIPLFPNVSRIIFSIIYCLLAVLLCIKQSKVVDIVGKFLTPALLIGLLLLIIAGIINPALTTTLPPIDNIIEKSIKDGYQTLDALASLIFGAILYLSIRNKGYTKDEDIGKILVYSSLLASILLFIVYGGLCYLGAFSSPDNSISISRADLLISIVQNLMGKTGLSIFAIVVFLACLTTGIAVQTSTAKYFSELSKGKISYKVFCVIISLWGAITANIGLDAIVAFAAPLLDLVYPPFLVLIIKIVFFPRINQKVVYASAITATTISTLNIINQHIYPINIMTKLPMHNLGLDWFIPTLVVMAICLIFKRQPQENQ